jgi:putative ATPase
MELFEHSGATVPIDRPLAARLRPLTLDDIVGQDHILGPNKLLRRAIEADRLSSLIIYGPPGCGKTSLAEVIARATEKRFERASGVLANVATLRTVIGGAELHRQQHGKGTILFVDEIHRFNKSQQDVLLPHVEDGTVTLIGATTHNPLFFINNALTSRSLVFELRAHTEEDIRHLLERALARDERLLAQGVTCDPDAILHLARLSEGDARRALSALELAVLTTPSGDGATHIDLETVQESIQKKAVVYDHDEDGHYDTISAFIKSIRGSDPHAAIYWLGKMLYAGEDPRFVARRLVILASEDVGNADPRGLLIATAAMQSVDFVGMPEARIILAQATTYLATAPKSNASYMAINAAMSDVENGRTLDVPEHLKNVHVKSVEKAEAEGYKYPHAYAGKHVTQSYMPCLNRYYDPAGHGYEATILERMQRWEGTRPDSEPKVRAE